MLLINKAIVTENNTIISVGAFTEKGDTSLTGIIIFQKDSKQFKIPIEKSTVIYDIIEYRPNIVLLFVSNGACDYHIKMINVSANDHICETEDYISTSLNIDYIDCTLPIFAEEYRFAKTLDGTTILYYNLKSPNSKTKSIIISLKDDVIGQSVVVVDRIMHSDNIVNEFRSTQLGNFRLIEVTPLIKCFISADSINDSVLILKFVSRQGEFSSHDIIAVDSNEVLINYQVCYNKLIIICRGEFDGELISKLYIFEYEIAADGSQLIKNPSVNKICL